MADPTAPLGLALDADGDIEVTVGTNDSGIRLAAGLEAVTNNIRSFLKLFKGEWFADLETGIPWFQDILGAKYSEKEIIAIFREGIFEVPHVVQIQRISSQFNTKTRSLMVYFEVLTVFGVVSDMAEI